MHSCIKLFKINMHELFILLLTISFIYLIDFIIKTPLIYSINIIIIIFFLNVLDFAYYVSLQRLIPVPQCCNCHYFATLLFLNFVYMDLLLYNIQRITKWIKSKWITIVLIRVIHMLFKMTKFYLSKMTKN